MDESVSLPECEVPEVHPTNMEKPPRGKKVRSSRRRKTATEKTNIDPKILKFKNTNYVSQDFKCTKFFHTVEDFQKHKNRKNLVCGYCDKMFQNKSKLFSHLNEHKENEPPLRLLGDSEQRKVKRNRSKNLRNAETVSYNDSEGQSTDSDHSDFPPDSNATPEHVAGREATSSENYELNSSEEHNIVIYPEVFQNLSDVTAAHGSEKPFQCLQCNKQFARKKNLAQHMQVHVDYLPFACPVCEKGFKNKQNLKIHARLHDGQLPFKCSYCDKRFNHQTHMANHMLSMHNRCNQCPEQFEGKEELLKHIAKHDTENRKCEFCETEFENHLDLSQHASEHVKDGQFCCNICKTKFKTAHTLKEHFRAVHKAEKPFTCPECGKSFFSGYYLRIHVRTVHSGEKIGFCDICGKSFSTTANLALHQKIHSGTPSFKCEMCDASFYQKHNLKVHYRKHTGEKPHLCSICGKRFQHANGLKLHTRGHTGEKPYKCDICDKTYASNSRLNVHLRWHRGEKKYLCKVCGVRYVKLESLKEHTKKIHHGGDNATFATSSFTQQGDQNLYSYPGPAYT